MHEAILKIPDRVWEPAYDADGQVRQGAWVADLTGLQDPSSWELPDAVSGRYRECSYVGERQQ